MCYNLAREEDMERRLPLLGWYMNKRCDDLDFDASEDMPHLPTRVEISSAESSGLWYSGAQLIGEVCLEEDIVLWIFI